jgi:hypothetical protein
MADENKAAPLPGLASEEEILRQTLEGLRADIAKLTASQSGWRAYAAEWMKPPVILSILVAMISISGLGLYFRDTLRTATENNDRQDQSLAGLSTTIAPLPRLIERLTDRMDAAENRQKEELLSWREWRKGVDESVQASRDLALAQQANKTQIESLDTRISRVVEMFQQANRETNAKLERILIEQAEVKARLGQRGDQPAPFGQNQIWPYPTPDPFTLRTANDCRAWSPIIEARFGWG